MDINGRAGLRKKKQNITVHVSISWSRFKHVLPFSWSLMMLAVPAFKYLDVFIVNRLDGRNRDGKNVWHDCLLRKG